MLCIAHQRDDYCLKYFMFLQKLKNIQLMIRLRIQTALKIFYGSTHNNNVTLITLYYPEHLQRINPITA